MGTQTPVHHHLTLSRVCTGIYFGYFACLPILNLIDLYFFENNPAKAKEHIMNLKKTIIYYLKIVPTLIKRSIIWFVYSVLYKVKPTEKTIEYYKVAFAYYFLHGMYFWYGLVLATHFII